MNFSHLLKELRAESKMTAKELSSKIGYSTNLIYDWEKGRAEPNCETLVKLAGIFDVSVDYLLGRTDDFGVKIDNNAGTLSNDEIHVLNEYRKLLPAYKDLIKKQLELFNEDETQIIKR